MINILPEKDKKILRYEFYIRFLSIIFIFITIFGLLAAVLFLPTYFISHSKKLQANQKLEIFNNENGDMNQVDLNNSISLINSKLGILSDNSAGDNKYITKSISDFLLLRPKGISFYSILCNEKLDKTLLFNIQGRAFDRTTLSGFKVLLENNPIFSDINLPLSSFINNSNIDFDISFTMK